MSTAIPAIVLSATHAIPAIVLRYKNDNIEEPIFEEKKEDLSELEKELIKKDALICNLKQELDIAQRYAATSSREIAKQMMCKYKCNDEICTCELNPCKNPELYIMYKDKEMICYNSLCKRKFKLPTIMKEMLTFKGFVSANPNVRLTLCENCFPLLKKRWLDVISTTKKCFVCFTKNINTCNHEFI